MAAHDNAFTAAFDIASGMEDDLSDVAALANAVHHVACQLNVDFLRDKDAASLTLLASQISDRAKALEARRGELFDVLHPHVRFKAKAA